MLQVAGPGPHLQRFWYYQSWVGLWCPVFLELHNDSNGQLGLRTAVSRRYFHFYPRWQYLTLLPWLLASSPRTLPWAAWGLFPTTLVFVIIAEPLLVTRDYEEVTDHFLPQEHHWLWLNCSSWQLCSHPHSKLHSFRFTFVYRLQSGKKRFRIDIVLLFFNFMLPKQYL